MNELISVIVPVYNVERYVARCVESLLNQSYRKLEIILVDDGSTDKSGLLCDSFLALDDRISVYHKANGGLSSARNFGMEHSSGEVYAFIDSDDYVHPDFFKVLLDAREETGADIISSDMYLFTSESEVFNINANRIETNVIYGTEILKEYFRPTKKRLHIYHGLCMKIYDRRLFEKLEFEEGRLHEDLYMTYKLLERSNAFCYVDVPYYYYFQGNGGSICKNFNKKNFVDKYEAFEEMKDTFILDNNIKSDFIHFLIFQYLDLMSKGSKLEDRDVKILITKAKSWIRDNLKYDTNLSFVKKILVLLMLKELHLYEMIFGK